MATRSRMIGGVLLVAGTTIGAGMLALPVATGLAGFFPSALLLFVYWIYMTYTALLTLEANLWFKKEANLVSLSRDVLGRPGEVISWIFYLYLLYALTTAYIAGSAPIFHHFAWVSFGVSLPSWADPLPLLALFGLFVYAGTHVVDRMNRCLMIGLVITYLAMLLFIFPEVQWIHLSTQRWMALQMGLSIVATSFGFHIIIPSLTAYLHRDPVALRQCILYGSCIPLVVYLVWELLSLGVIPYASLVKGYAEGVDGGTLLSQALQNPEIGFFAKTFAFFAIVTSFMGVSLSLSHFLEDGLRMKKTTFSRLLIFLLTFMPPLIITWVDPRAFLGALEYAGAFGVVVLLGLIPAIIVWIGRYRQKKESVYQVAGGKCALVLTMLFSLAVILLELMNKLNLGF